MAQRYIDNYFRKRQRPAQDMDLNASTITNNENIADDSILNCSIFPKKCRVVDDIVSILKNGNEFEESLIEESWLNALRPYVNEPSFRKLKEFLLKEYMSRTDIYPPPNLIFSWSHHCSLSKLRVVILGQDPYHNEGQAMGLSFSVPMGIAVPPSLKNIYAELRNDLGAKFTIPSHGCLEKWADQGVLLLNAVLTVRAHQAGSHSNEGWESFTDGIIEVINASKKNVVFLLWGNYAIKKGSQIDKGKHCILTSVHPSPLSVHRGFFGCRHFSKTNSYLESHGLPPIDWNL